MKPVSLIVETNGPGFAGTRLELKNSMPGLLWAEFVHALSDYAKFEEGKKGTRFDKWLQGSIPINK